MQKALLSFLFLLTANISYAQEKEPLAGWGVEVNPIYGKVIKHNYIFPPLPDYSYAIDINILKQTDGSKDWHIRRKYPLVGLGLTYTDYGIDSVYGRCIGIYPVWQFNIIRRQKVELTTRFGYGIGYVTKRFERYPSFNTENNLIGSHLNNFTMFTTQMRYKASNQLHFHAGFNFTHISNGSFRLPNLGVNLYGGHFGMRYFPVTDNPDKIKRQVVTLSNRWLAQFRIGMGFVEYNNVDGPTYPIHIASAYASKRYGSRNKIMAGVDYCYYKSVESFLRNNEIDPGNEKAQSWEGAVFVGHEFIIGRFGVLAHIGVPFKHTKFNKDKTIQKLGYCYYIIQQEKGILKELTANCFVKSNNLEASHIEFSIGAGF